MESLLNNIFSMRFDVLVPLSFCLIAIVVSFILFFVRFLSYRKMKKKFAKAAPVEEEKDPVLLAMLAKDPDCLAKANKETEEEK